MGSERFFLGFVSHGALLLTWLAVRFPWSKSSSSGGCLYLRFSLVCRTGAGNPDKGLRLAAAIKAKRIGAHPPVALLHEGVRDLSNCHSSCSDDFLLAPYSQDGRHGDLDVVECFAGTAATGLPVDPE